MYKEGGHTRSGNVPQVHMPINLIAYVPGMSPPGGYSESVRECIILG